jgi:hypothetical protein
MRAGDDVTPVDNTTWKHFHSHSPAQLLMPSVGCCPCRIHFVQVLEAMANLCVLLRCGFCIPPPKATDLVMVYAPSLADHSWRLGTPGIVQAVPNPGSLTSPVFMSEELPGTI